MDVTTGQLRNCADPLDLLEALGELKEQTVVLLRDFHLFLTDPNPLLLRKFKDALTVAKTRQTPLVIVGCRLCLPPELERELTVVEFQLPDTSPVSSPLTRKLAV